jgi:threonine aldolase
MSEAFRDRKLRAELGSARHLTGHPRLTQAAWLRALADSIEAENDGCDPLPDHRGIGATVEDLEQEVAALLGKPSAVLMPSGIMAQQAALRVWTDRSGHRTVAMHAASHFRRYELSALEMLHHLDLVVLTDEARPLRAGDLAAQPGPLGALTIELPLRDCAHVLPTWDQLSQMLSLASARGIPTHLDGARLFESATYLGHSAAEVAALADSTYISLYKGLGAPAGAVLAGQEDFISEARQWRHRLGGNLPSLFYLAAAGRYGLRTYLPRLPSYVAKARELAIALGDSGHVSVAPSIPQTNTFLVFLKAPPGDLNRAVVEHAEETSVWSFPRDFRRTEFPGYSVAEFIVGEETMGWESSEVDDLLVALEERALASSP